MCDMIDVASQDEFESHPVYKVLYLLRRQGVSLMVTIPVQKVSLI